MISYILIAAIGTRKLVVERATPILDFRRENFAAERALESVQVED